MERAFEGGKVRKFARGGKPMRSKDRVGERRRFGRLWKEKGGGERRNYLGVEGGGEWELIRREKGCLRERKTGAGA